MSNDPIRTRTDTEDKMALLPNQYHPGRRCSCRECLSRYPDHIASAGKKVRPAAVVEFVNGRASVILDSKFLSGLTEGSHVLFAAPQEHDAISGSYAPTRPAVAALGKRIDEEPITHGTPSPTEVHPPVLEPITQTWAGKEPSEAAIALFDYLENRPSTDCEWTKGYN